MLLILLGAVLLVNPRIPYSKSQKIPQTKYSVSTAKILVVPRVVAGLVVVAGLAAVLFAGKDSRHS